MAFSVDRFAFGFVDVEVRRAHAAFNSHQIRAIEASRPAWGRYLASSSYSSPVSFGPRCSLSIFTPAAFHSRRLSRKAFLLAFSQAIAFSLS